MMDLCKAERVGWATMTALTALVASIPWLQPLAEHGKLMARPPSKQRESGIWDRLQAGFFGVPKGWFAHFYVLGLVTSTLAIADIVLRGGSLVATRLQAYSVCSRKAARHPEALELGAESLICLFLIQAHLCRRLWECLFVTRWGSSKMTLAGYFVGIFHYQLVILMIVVEAPAFGSLKLGESGNRIFGEDGLLGLSAREMLDAGYRLAESAGVRHAFALGLFFLASGRQNEAIRHLASLRSSSTSATVDGKVTSNAYSIPVEGWFPYVSCPHNFTELMIYASLYLLAGTRGSGLGQGYQLVGTWVFANQALLAGRVHAWYQRKFEDYPRDRKRLIPGVW